MKCKWLLNNLVDVNCFREQALLGLNDETDCGIRRLLVCNNCLMGLLFSQEYNVININGKGEGKNDQISKRL